MTHPKPRPKPQTYFSLAGRRMAIESSGPVGELVATFYVGETKGYLSWYYIWFQDVKTHAPDYALLHKLPQPKWNIFGQEDLPSFTSYYEPAGLRVDGFAPAGNRTQVGIARQEADWFLVRFIIEFNKGADRHQFMLKYKGKAPQSYFDKPLWGTAFAAGDTPGSVDSIVW